MSLPNSRTDREYRKFVEDDEGNVALRTTATISGDVNVDSVSIATSGYVGKASGTNGDFTTAYASGTTITASSLPSGVSALNDDDIVSIVQINSSGEVQNTYSRDDVTITTSGTDPTTITVTGATFGATDSFIVYTNINRAVESATNLQELAGNAIDLGAGNVSTGTQRVTLASDQASVSVDATGSGDVPITLDGESVAVTGTVTANAGTT